MINKTLSQKGSAHVVIIVILVIALIGVLGFVFWQNFMVDKNTANTQNDSTIVEETEESNTDASKTNQLTLNDWNIHFTIATSLASTEVKYEAKDTDSYVFTTSRIEALGGECATSPFGDTVSLTRFAEKPLAVPDGELLNESPINNYYYVLSGPISSCSNLDSNQQSTGQVNSIETNDRDALKATMRTLSAN